MSTKARTRVPSYRRHKPTGQAVCTIEGHDLHLGTHGTPRRRERYGQLIAEYLGNGRPAPDPGDRVEFERPVQEMETQATPEGLSLIEGRYYMRHAFRYAEAGPFLAEATGGDVARASRSPACPCWSPSPRRSAAKPSGTSTVARPPDPRPRPVLPRRRHRLVRPRVLAVGLG